MKAEIKEMETLLNETNRQTIWTYLMNHRPESADETRLYEKLRSREYSLRNTSTEETEKTKRLLNNFSCHIATENSNFVNTYLQKYSSNNVTIFG